MRKAQSAMEYLMTYGWAILVIAIVLGVMYALGVFNGINTVPRAQPGTCSIFRPNGAGTSYDINFQGECQPQLPEFVAQFNGQTSEILAPLASSATTGITVSVWAYWTSTSTVSASGLVYEGDTSPSYSGYGVTITNGACGGGTLISILVDDGACAMGSAPVMPTNTWVFLTFTRGSSTWNLYINGVLTTSTGTSSPIAPYGNTCIGFVCSTSPGQWNFNGLLANVQIYNSSLSQAEVTALYQEGIGGAPVRPQNIEGWWPLNGNPNDYSGNNNNGQPTSVHYVSNWTSSYTGPGAP